LSTEMPMEGEKRTVGALDQGRPGPSREKKRGKSVRFAGRCMSKKGKPPFYVRGGCHFFTKREKSLITSSQVHYLQTAKKKRGQSQSWGSENSWGRGGKGGEKVSTGKHRILSSKKGNLNTIIITGRKRAPVFMMAETGMKKAGHQKSDIASSRKGKGKGISGTM